MTFNLEHHNKILTLLESLDCKLLEESKAYFGGGTLLALDFGEYRLSNDVDFICPVPSPGYKKLRKAIYESGYEKLFWDRSKMVIGSKKTDQYAIRMLIEVDGTPIKTEIITEVRFQLDPPRHPRWSPVACLSLIDCFTSKLLCNADRFMDDSVQGRDLIDLAILRLQCSIPPKAIEKAEKTYEVMRPLRDAVERFQRREEYREQCFFNLQIDEQNIPKVIDGIDLLATDFNLPITKRRFNEQHDVLESFFGNDIT